MYFPRFLVRLCMLIFLVLDLINLAVSDDNLFVNDLLGNDAGANDFLNNLDGSSLLDQSTNDVTTENNLFDNELLADNVGVDYVQSCHQPNTKLKRRQPDGQSCLSSDSPGGSVFLPEDERVVSKSEVKKYWCSRLGGILFADFPVCSVDPSPLLPFYQSLESTLSLS